jgi:hypothetical protein
MENKNTFYIYDKNQEVVEIRTRVVNQARPMYVIQYPQPRRSPVDRIRYRSEIVSEEKFYSPIGIDNMV